MTQAQFESKLKKLVGPKLASYSVTRRVMADKKFVVHDIFVHYVGGGCDMVIAGDCFEKMLKLLESKGGTISA